MKSDENENTKKKKGWIAPTITTLVGVVVSLLVAWYQINLSDEQIQEAEKERSKSVKRELVQIVEEHIINQKPLDISRLSRLADFRAQEENLLTAPTVSEIVENSEFNIIKSQYLEFDKKQQFKEIFNGIYAEIYTPDKVDYSGMSENAVNDILASINEGNNKEVSAKIIKLATDFSSKIEELEAQSKTRDKKSLTDFIKVLLEKPEIWLIATLIYAMILYVLMYIRRRLRRERLLRSRFENEDMDDYVRERNEFMHEKYKNKFDDAE